LYLNTRDWKHTDKITKEENLLQSRTKSRTIRVTREIIQRLELLRDAQLELLVEGNLDEQKYILWFAICQTYQFIEEFATEVLREKFLSRSMLINEFDYDAFFNRKADWNEELDQITASTRIKLRTVIFRMMREAGLISKEKMIIPVVLSKRLVEVLKPDAPMSFQIFPTEPSTIQG
jgi:hypothetical protein